MLKRKQSPLNNEKGMAAFEMIPILVVVVLFMNFSFGFFGAIHTGIMNSISARNYAFETFRHRANLTYFRNTSADNAVAKIEYSKVGLRVHGIASEKRSSSNQDWSPSSRLIDFFSFDKRAVDPAYGANKNHQASWEVKDGQRVKSTGVNPIWIKTHYGICLNAACGT